MTRASPVMGPVVWVPRFQTIRHQRHHPTTSLVIISVSRPTGRRVGVEITAEAEPVANKNQ